MKRLDRYMLKEMVPTLFWGTVVVTLLFIANFVIAEYRFLNIENLPWVAKIQLLLYQTPVFLQMTLPVGVSLGGAMAMSRLVRESELTVIRASGVSIKRVIVPFACMGAVVAVLNYLDTEKLMPPAQKKLRETISKVGVLNTIPNFRSNVPLAFDKYLVSIGSVQRQGETKVILDNVLIIERPKAKVVTLTFAEGGVYEKGLWKLPNAKQYTFDGDDVLQFTVKEVLINEQIAIRDLMMNPVPEEETAATLRKTIQGLKAAGQKTNELEVKYYARYSVPVVCLLFGIVSPVFAVRFARSGGVAGLILSIFLVFLYYNAYMISTEVFGRLGWVPPVVAAWLPNLLFAGMGLVAMWGLE